MLADLLSELSALIDKPLVLVVVMAAGGVIGIAIESAFNRIERERRRAYWRGRNWRAKAGGARPVPSKKEPEARAADAAAEQLKAVMRADFRARALLNRREAELFKTLDALVTERNPAWRVMAQVCVGEFVGSEDADAHAAINSKRVDFALMDADARVRHAIEYQGDGHHQGNAAARDAVKREALRKAGVGWHEVVAGETTRADLRRLVERLVPVGVVEMV